jgi:hypothetical protein
MRMHTPTSGAQQKRSRLATLLWRATTECDFPIENWAELLLKKKEEVEAWIADRSLPSAEDLTMIFETLNETSGVPIGLREEVSKILDLPMLEVTPFASSTSMREYLLQTRVDTLNALLLGIPADQKGKILDDMFAVFERHTIILD